MQVVNDYHIGVPDLDNLGASFLAVITQDERGLLKVYTGIVRLPPTDNPSYSTARVIAGQRVMSHGQPENFERAKTYFPMIEATSYRR